MKARQARMLLLLVVNLILLSCGFSSEPKPTPTPPVPFIGGFLLLGNDGENGLAILEFKEGMTEPQPLWTGIPGRVNAPSEKPSPVIVASPDHKHALVMQEFSAILIIDLTNGEFIRIPLPEREHESTEYYDLAAEFSPDSRYLAYALTGRGSTHSGMYLYDLTTQKQSILFTSPCATYGGKTISLVCGEVKPPFWLDATTLKFSAFEGQPPKTTIAGIISPNHTFVMDVTGKRLPDSVSAVLSTQSAQGLTALPEAVDAVHSGSERTPDGLSVLRWQRVRQNVKGAPFADTWHLINLSSGADQELHHLFYCEPALNIITYGVRGLVWSPDGKSFACMTTAGLYVSYLDDLPYRNLLGNFYGYMVDWRP